MRPETVHLLATLCRHGRGLVNAVEKFERTVPREERAREVATLVAYAREAITAAEHALTAPSID